MRPEPKTSEGFGEAGSLKRILEDRNIGFPVRPRIVGDLSIFQMPDGLGIQLRGGPNPVALRGPQADAALAFLLPALDGTRSLNDLLEQCPAQVPRTTMLRTLTLLHMKGLLTGNEALAESRGNDRVLARQHLFWGRKLGITGAARSADEIQCRLETSRLVLIGTGLFGAATYDLLVRTGSRHIQVLDWDDGGLFSEAVLACPVTPVRLINLRSRSVEELGRQLPAVLEAGDLLVTATRNAPAELFAIINRICLDRLCPWLRANEDGTQIEIGPYVRPYGSSCFRCLELRQASAQDFAVEERLYQQHLAKVRPAGETLPRGECLPASMLAASLVSLEVLRIVTGIAVPTLLNAVMTFNSLEGDWRTNQILRVPRCPECYPGSNLPKSEEAINVSGS